MKWFGRSKKPLPRAPEIVITNFLNDTIRAIDAGEVAIDELWFDSPGAEPDPDFVGYSLKFQGVEVVVHGDALKCYGKHVCIRKKRWENFVRLEFTESSLLQEIFRACKGEVARVTALRPQENSVEKDTQEQDLHTQRQKEHYIRLARHILRI